MVTPAERRRDAAYLAERYAISERRACRLLVIWRATKRYRTCRGSDEQLQRELERLATEYPRYGYRRLHWKLRRGGMKVNRKKLYRVYRQMGLMVTKRKRKRMARARTPAALPVRLNQRWSMDFVSDSLARGRRFRVLNVVDDYSREVLAADADTSIGGLRVARVLDHVAAERGAYPESIVCDNGPEFISAALDMWASEHAIRLHFIQPGKPVQNCFVESFNGKFRDECLNQHWFVSLEDARQIIGRWADEYNEEREHSSLAGLTPREFAQGRKSAVETAENADSAFPAVPTAPAAITKEVSSTPEDPKISSTNNPAALTL